ncbi:hypothetical protein, partial [Pseudomonas gingeri]|uniref:hypothetical protein n=1 Tax=Pseudomonas gingeri TaxID=117681 RepID=UPI001AE080C7
MTTSQDNASTSINLFQLFSLQRIQKINFVPVSKPIPILRACKESIDHGSGGRSDINNSIEAP